VTSESLTTETSELDGGTRVRLVGELDMQAADRLDEELAGVQAASPARLWVDLSGLTFLDSSGLRVLLRTLKRAADSGGELVLVPGPPNVHHVFTLTKLVDRFRFDDGVGADADGADGRSDRDSSR
jgi:anti-sigma B factor antagonist